MSSLREKSCSLCALGGSPLKGQRLIDLKKQIDTTWELVEEHHLMKTFSFKNFSQGVKFINAIAEVAEKENHHPDVNLSYKSVKITLFTHKIKGLSESDFIMADKIDAIYTSMSA